MQTLNSTQLIIFDHSCILNGFKVESCRRITGDLFSSLTTSPHISSPHFTFLGRKPVLLLPLKPHHEALSPPTALLWDGKGQGVTTLSWLALMDALMGASDETLIEWAAIEEEKASLPLSEDCNGLAELTATQGSEPRAQMIMIFIHCCVYATPDVWNLF